VERELGFRFWEILEYGIACFRRGGVGRGGEGRERGSRVTVGFFFFLKNNGFFGHQLSSCNKIEITIIITIIISLIISKL